MKSYTLDQLAHFNRCLFPGDFVRDMRVIGGMSKEDSRDLEYALNSTSKQTGGQLNLLDLYQDYAIPDRKFRKCLELVLADFFSKK